MATTGVPPLGAVAHRPPAAIWRNALKCDVGPPPADAAASALVVIGMILPSGPFGAGTLAVPGGLLVTVFFAVGRTDVGAEG